MSSTKLQKTEEDAALLPTDTVEELGRPEVTTQESPTDDGENVHDKPGQEKTESVDVVQAQTLTSSDNNEELEPSSQPLQSVVNRSTAGCTATTDTNRTVVSTAEGGENVSEKCRGYSTLDDLMEDSRDGFGMQIVETSPGQGKNKKKAGRKRKKGEKSLKPRKLRLILPHPEGAEGEGSNAGFLDPSFESHLEDIGRNYSLSTTNVKSILHRVITNESVVAMMRHSVKEDHGEEETEGDISTNNPLAELFEPKMTRARAKEVAEKGSFVVPWPISPVKKPAESQPAKFIDLSFEEDEDDDEYEPEDDENEESDIDSIASREASDFGSPMPSTPRQFLRTYSESDRKDDSEDTDDRQETAEQGGKVEPHIKIQPTPMGPPLPPLSKEKTDAAFLSELDTFDEELSELSGRTARSTMDFNTEENLGLIANRTRSKCPLKDTPIDILEAAFHAPDITQDMYDTECDDSEWQGWLKGLFKTDLDMSGDADDEQNDPDYNFLQEEEEVDTEDLRDDRAVRITKKEVNELMDELLQQYEEEMEQLGGDAAPGLDDSTTTDPLTPPPSRTFVKPPPISFDGPLSTVMAKTHKTVQQQLQDEKMRGKVPGGGRKVQSLPVLTQEERQQLQQQMQQHVQLLCQVHVLTREEPQLQEVAQVTKNFLKENQMFVQRSTQLHQMQVEQYSSTGTQVPQVAFHSMFDTCNLQGAVDIVDQNIPVRSFTASPMKKTAKGSKGHKAKPPASSQATIAESKVFMYPALLPTCALDLHDPLRHGKEKPCFLGAEDNLLALGMCQYQGMSTVEMLHYIRENMIPTKTCEQIRIRIKNLKANKKKTGNIVQVYSKTKQMPALPVVCPDMEAAQAVSPVHLQGKHLPGWLQDYQQTNQPKANSLLSTKMRNLSPKKTEKMSPTQRDILPKGFVPVMSVKKALFQSPSKPHSTVTTTNSSTTSATVSTSTGTTENPAKTLQTLAPKSAGVSHISSVDSSTPVYIMLPSNVVPGNLSQTSPPVAGLQGHVQPLGGAAGGVVVVVSPPSTTASMSQPPQTVVSSTVQTIENSCLQPSLSNSTASNVSVKEEDMVCRVESSSPVTAPSSLVESTCVTSSTDPLPEQSQTCSQSTEKEAMDSREGELPCTDSTLSNVQLLQLSSQETAISDVNHATPLAHATSPGLSSSKETSTVEKTVTSNQTDTNVFVKEIPVSVDEGNQNMQSQEDVVSTNLPEATGPERTVTLTGTMPDEETGMEDLEGVSEDICVVEDSSTPLEPQENQITQNDVSEQNVRTEGACLQQPDIEQPEGQGVFMVQSDSTERPCLDQPCTEQPRVPLSAEEITAHPSEEVPSDQVVTEDNPVVPVPEDVLVSSTEEQELMVKEVEAEQGPDVDNLSEEQSATSKRMVMKVKNFKKKAKGRRKQLQKDMASTLLLLDSDLMDRDLLREERETMMAKNFLERVRDSLREEEGKYHEVLQVFHQGHQEGRTIVQLYQELQKILARWPGLLGEFAAFLQPAEAVECDLFMEHQEYVQARSFLRKLEVFFSDNPDHYQKVLRVFASYMREGASLEGLRQEITPLLQGQPYLLQEFTRFFPDLPPPQSMMGDFEEIHMASDSDGDEVPDNFEEIVLPDEDDEDVSREKKQVDPWKLLLAQKHGTKECKCECHESSTDLRVQRRNRHCVACNTKLTPKDLQAKKDIILRHQALLHTRESPIPDRTGRKIPAKRRRKKTGSETARDSPSLDTAMVEDSCSSPLNQGYDLAGSENSSARPQKSSSHQMSVLAKFSPLGSGQEAGVGDEEGMRKLSANEEDAEESSQESDEELEQVTEEAVRNLRDLCEEIPAPDWQKSATIVESFRRRLQEIAQHEYEEEEEEEEDEEEDEDKLSSGDESQDAEFSDLEEASGSGSASPSSLQALSAATSPGAASQGSEESPKSHTTSGPSQQGLAASTSPGAASLSEESPRSHTKAGISQKGLADVLSPDTASQRSGGLPKVHITSGKSQLELSATISQGEGAAVRSPDIVLQVSQDLPKAPTPTKQSKTAEPVAVASQVSKELPKTSGRGPDIALQGTGESPGASITMGEGKSEGLETATEVAGTDTGNTSGVELSQENVSSQKDGAADQLTQDLGNNTVEVGGSRDGSDSRTLRGSMQDSAINQKGEKITEDHHTTSSDSGRQSISEEHSETHDHLEVGATSKRNVPSCLGSGTSDTVEVMTADSFSQGTDKEENETDTLRHKEEVSTRSEGEDEKMEVTEGQDQAEEKGSSGDGTILWTRDQDRTLLQACQQQGATAETFAIVAEQLGDRTPQQVTDRFMELMALYHQQGTSTDEETGTDGETEEEGSEYSTEQDPGDVEDD